MQHRSDIISIQVTQVLDLLFICVGMMLALVFRDVCLPFLEWLPFIRVDLKRAASYRDISPLIYGLGLFLPIVLEKFGFYGAKQARNIFASAISIIQSLIVYFGVFASLAILLKLEQQNRSILLSIAITLFVVLLFRVILSKLFLKRVEKVVWSKKTILAGDQSAIGKWLEAKEDAELANIEIVSHFDCSNSKDDLEKILAEFNVERVIFVTGKAPFEDIARASRVCEIMGVEACLVSDFLHSRIATPSFDTVCNQPMLVLRSTPIASWEVLIKSLFDRVGALFLIIVTSPLWVLAVLGILLSSGRPIFFRQSRAGLYAKPFMMWKFRTMGKDAESELKNLKANSVNEMSGPVFKMENDPRVFPFGRWMRKTSLDELPQLINVLFGQMSLVGPRPMASYEISEIERLSQRRKLSVKPGITCIWQVEGRNKIHKFDEWVELDLEYIDNWSLWLDIKILCKTIPAVLFSKGAK